MSNLGGGLKFDGTPKGFYTEILGFNIDPAFNLTDFALFETNSIPFALTKSNLKLEEAAQPGLGITLRIDCDGVNELWAKLAAAGVTILKPPFDGPFGCTFILADPDGYQITANENPGKSFL